MFSFLLFRGVFSSLIEKHFPAPNRAKMAGLFGLSFDPDTKAETKERNGKRKRKRGKFIEYQIISDMFIE